MATHGSLTVAPAEAGRPAPTPPQPMLSAEDAHFLECLMGLSDAALDAFTGADEVFLTGVAKRVHGRNLQIPMLPEAAVRLSELVRRADWPIQTCADLVAKEAALSVEVLRAANAAVYGGSITTSIREAIMRLGASRLNAVLMLSHLNGRVLKGSLQFRRYGERLLELSEPLAALASRLARPDQGGDFRFVRGLLMHLEHVVIVGMLGDISRELRVSLTPSVEALHCAFRTFGPGVRASVLDAWGIGALLGGTGNAWLPEYEGLRHAVIRRWLGQPLPALPGVDAGALADAMAAFRPRVASSGTGTPAPGGAD